MLTRDGKPPAIPAQPIARADGMCGYTIDITSLFGLSARHLRDVGLGTTTPITLLEDGKPMSAFASRNDYENRCTGAFNVGRNVVRFSPSGDSASAAESHEYAVILSDDLPLTTPDGPAWWVYSEHALTAAFDEDAGQAGNAVTVTVKARSPQNQAKAVPALVLGSHKVELAEVSPHHWEATLTATIPAGTWSAQVVSPGDGPYLLVDSWELSSEGKTRSLLVPPQLTVAAIGGDGASPEALLAPGVVTFAGAPPELPAAELVAIGDLAAKFTLDELAPLASKQVGERIGVKYSPVRVLEDGEPLAAPMSPCPRVKREGNGQYCHSHNVLLFSASDSTSPADNGRSYALALDAERRFDGGWWMYPDDSLTGATFHGDAVSIDAKAVTDGAALTVSLLNGAGEAVAVQTFDAGALAAGPVTISASAQGDYTLALTSSGYVVAQGARVLKPQAVSHSASPG